MRGSTHTNVCGHYNKYWHKLSQSQNGYTALLQACNSHHWGVAQVLMSEGADVNKCAASVSSRLSTLDLFIVGVHAVYCAGLHWPTVCCCDCQRIQNCFGAHQERGYCGCCEGK